MAHGLAGAAMHEAEQVFGDLPESRDKRFLYALGSWVLERC
jgi:geranylgeranyl diphosphate synthase type II